MAYSTGTQYNLLLDMYVVHQSLMGMTDTGWTVDCVVSMYHVVIHDSVTCKAQTSEVVKEKITKIFNI